MHRPSIAATIARFLLAVFLLATTWWIACEGLRERAPMFLGIFLVVLYFPLTIACMLRIPKAGIAFALLLVALLGIDIAVDAWIPYEPRLLFPLWQAARLAAVLAASVVVINVERPSARMRATMGVVLAIGLAMVLVIGGCVARIAIEGPHDETHAAEGALVLGFALDEQGRPQPSLIARVDHAVDLYRRGQVRWIAMSGGVVHGEVSEASVMRDLAIARGVPASAILVEEHSHSTRENFEFSRAVVESQEAHDVLLVTEPFHMIRALTVSRVYGFDLRPSPAMSPVWSDPRRACYWVFRDALLLAAEFVIMPLEKGRHAMN